MSYYGDFSDVYIKSNFSIPGFGKRAVLVLNDYKAKGWEKFGNVSLESCSYILEETRHIQDPVQFRARQQNFKDN